MKRYQIEIYTEIGQSFSYYIQSITKSAYEYWSENGGASALFRHLLELTETGSCNVSELEKTFEEYFPDIPKEAMVMPNEDKLIDYCGAFYAYSSFLSGWLYHFDPDDLNNYVIKVYELLGDEVEPSLVWKGTLADLVNNDANALKHQAYTTRQLPGYYMHFTQSERATLVGAIETVGEWDLSRLYIETSIDEFYGECLKPDSFLFRNDKGVLEKMNLYFEPLSSQTHPFDLYDGIELCDPVE